MAHTLSHPLPYTSLRQHPAQRRRRRPLACRMGRRAIPRQADVRVVSRQQWTPELAEDIAARRFRALCRLLRPSPLPGRVSLTPRRSRSPAAPASPPITWSRRTSRLGPRTLWLHARAMRMLLTVGVGSTELGEAFSDLSKPRCPRLRHAGRSRSATGNGRSLRTERASYDLRSPYSIGC